MGFERPTLDTLVNRAISDLESRLQSADARLARSFENVICYVLAGLVHGLHGHLFYLSKFLPDNCDETLLRRWAAILNVTPKDPSKATGALDLTGVNATVVPAGTTWSRNDGVEFVSDAEVTIAAGVATAQLTAVLTGDDGNTAGTTELTLVTPVAGLDAEATVDGDGLTGGADAEDVEALRARVLDRLRVPPSGGGPGDYERWALEVPGVTRAWEYPAELGAGTVSVRFAVDGEVSPIPSGGKVAEVQAYLDARAPVTADTTVVAPTAATQNFTIDLGATDTTAIRAAVEAELEAFLLRAGEPGGTLYWSQINEAISLASGEVDHTLTVPAADVVLTTGQLPVMGTITWT